MARQHNQAAIFNQDFFNGEIPLHHRVELLF